MGLGGASRDDANDFFFFVFFIKSMNDQQNRTRPYGSDRYPTFLILSDVTLRNRVGIVENENGSFKANIVLAKILAVLVLIPYESHSKSRQDTITAEVLANNQAENGVLIDPTETSTYTGESLK